MAISNHAFKQLSQLPLNCQYYLPKPLHYPKDSNSIIISSDSDENNAGVFKYNLNNNNLEILQQYIDLEILSNDHGHFIDYNNDTLYILGGSYGSYYAMDLKTKKITVMDTRDCGDYPKCVQLSSTNGDEIHIISDCKNHFKLEPKDKQLTSVNSNKDVLHGIRDVKLLYVESTKQIMILGGHENDNIYYCNIQQPYEWKLRDDIKMPHVVDGGYCSDVLLFGNIIIVFYFDVVKDLYDIWCLDLFYYKWYKSKYNVPKAIGYRSYFIKSKSNNDVHVLDFDRQLHFAVDIYDLFPNDLIEERRKHSEILVIGFVKDEEKKNMISNIPSPLKQLILLFFPLFQ